MGDRFLLDKAPDLSSPHPVPVTFPFPILGLTGGIASGKSYVAALMARRGWAVLDADGVAREVVAPGSEGLAEVVAAFGPGCLLPDGTLDRAWLAAHVFAQRSSGRD
jgi:dephospho-CoA kinase